MPNRKPLTLLRTLCLGLLTTCLSLFSTAGWAALKPGDAAPDFTVDAALGGKEFTFSLADALKKGPVVLYFYPESKRSTNTAWTPSATTAVSTSQVRNDMMGDVIAAGSRIRLVLEHFQIPRKQKAA